MQIPVEFKSQKKYDVAEPISNVLNIYLQNKKDETALLSEEEREELIELINTTIDLYLIRKTCLCKKLITRLLL